MKSKLLFSAVLLALVTITGCYPGSDRSLQNTEIVYTTFDDNFDFSANKTYFLVDEVVDIDTGKTVDPSVQNTILNRVRSNMNAKGWTEITTTLPSGLPTTDVEVVILSSLLTGSIDGVSYWPGYGGWWGGYWGYPGFGYPGYGWGGVAIPYSYDVGTIFIDMVDYSTYDPDDEKSLTLIWTAAMNGVLSSVGTSDARIQRVIDQSFIQSPYL